ncbi:hypothetical protein PFICI_10435 [Pestalotiopsis fici W106-1]|uniref:SMP-30/Gluconolactonase/LRE-like region domain-containing protein n=1 Tax=Pestalotiopsis fici (strain W106-1 / CGMCC3.15140) TaxID=1229662 RepID=W3WWW7_PESFW|nr:uncharacterized protein PFICI_10435 [Pestalotiopsis fici W106-1]ETS78373.1 hypothetical protein PFICI_10435 [Pestalotiopsis fici W106-1]
MLPSTYLRGLVGLSAVQIAYGRPHSIRGDTDQAMVIQLIPEVPSLENLAIRRNGDIITTSTRSSSLYLTSPRKQYGADAILLHQSSNLNALLGIAELEEDVFYITGGAALTMPNPFNEVWKVDLRGLQISANGTIVQPPAIVLAGNDSTGGLYNGMTHLGTNDTNNILLADSLLGTVTRLDVTTGEFAVVSQDPLLATPNTTNLAVAVNGIHTYGNFIYFTNLNQGIFGRMPISLATGEQTGAAEILATGLWVADDFALSVDGQKAWVAMNGPDVIIEVDIVEKTSRVAFNSSLLGAASSVAKGRVCQDLQYLYVTTSQSNGNSTIGGIVRLPL